MTRKICGTTIIILTVLLVLSATIIADTGRKEPALALGVSEMVNEKIVEFYENEIAKEKFISNMSGARKARMCEKYGISENKLNAVLILQDLGARVGNPKSVDEMAKMNDKALFSTGKTLVLAYIDTLSDVEKVELKDKFNAVIKRR